MLAADLDNKAAGGTAGTKPRGREDFRCGLEIIVLTDNDVDDIVAYLKLLRPNRMYE